MSHFDQGHLQRLRLDVKLHAIDTSRAKIDRGVGDSFTVHLPRPMWDIAAVLDMKLPSTIVCRSAGEAEGELLAWLLRIVRAERQVCRTGRVVGWTGDQIARRPLSDAEISEYKEQLKYIAERDRISAQLSEALDAQKRRASVQQGVDHLTEQYGLHHTSKPVDAGANALKAAPAVESTTGAGRRAPVTRRGAKS